jgi:hypothetical protein
MKDYFPTSSNRRIDIAIRLIIIVIIAMGLSGCFDSSTEDPPPAVTGNPGPGTKPGPTVINDTLSVPVSTAGEVSVLDNDSTVNGALTIDTFDPVGSNGGNIANLGGGVFSYTPPIGYEGQDTFTYTVKDGSGESAKGTVTVTVSTLVIPNGKAYYANNCAICHAAGVDDTSVAFNGSDLAMRANPLQRDLSIYGGQYQLMGAFYDITQKNIDELKAYLATL